MNDSPSSEVRRSSLIVHPLSLAKLLFGYAPGFLGHGKARVLAMSLALDRRFSKHDQLRVFFNRVYLGGDENIRGFAAASRAYFNREFNGISDQEFLALLAMLSSPGVSTSRHIPT